MNRRLDEGQIEVVDDAMAEVLRQKTPAERVRMISDANRLMRTVICGYLRTRHPDWDDGHIAEEVIRRMSCGTG
jgi:hypothetical protein